MRLSIDRRRCFCLHIFINMSKLYYIKSEKGRNMLVNEDFLYKLNSVSNTKTIWRCTEYSKSKFNIRIHVQSEQIIKKNVNITIDQTLQK